MTFDVIVVGLVDAVSGIAHPFTGYTFGTMALELGAPNTGGVDGDASGIKEKKKKDGRRSERITIILLLGIKYDQDKYFLFISRQDPIHLDLHHHHPSSQDIIIIYPVVAVFRVEFNRAITSMRSHVF